MKNSPANARKTLWFWALMIVPAITLLANLSPATRADHYFAIAFELPNTEALTGNSETNLLSSEATPNVYESTLTQSDAPSFVSLGVSLAKAVLGRVQFWSWLVFAYALIALTLILRIPIGWIQLAKLRQSSTAILGTRNSRLYKEAADQIGYSGKCQVRLTDELDSPVSFGILSPIILFPESYYKELSDSELRSTLLHELSHIKNHDPLRVLLVKAVESLFFFQPLVWLASNRIHYLSELVADDSVLEAGVDTSSYANSIVNLIELGFTPNHPYKLSTGVFSSPGKLVSRMEHLLDNSHSHRTKLEGSNLALSGLAL
ncbi:MAG: M56 family metallopeptidase, partial [Pseudomonadales bacterium]|nr:M56 family metallopeptidase [Pseudomonadales bacterium]